MNSTHNAHAVLVDLFGELNMCKLSYAYNGQFTDELTKGLLTLSDQGMEQEQEARPTRRKVYFIMVESLQNITRHQGDADNRAADGFFVMNKFAKGYMVTSGNVVPNGDVEVLRGKLEKVNSLSGNELSDYYRKVLDEGQLSDKGGAGLGLIEMARKSGGKLVYQFKELSHRDSYFYFQCNVRGKDVEEHEQIFPEPALNTGLAERIHQTILDQRLELFYYGSFVHESLKGLLNMMEDGSKQQDTFLRKTLVSVMVELLQNICYHGAVLQEGSNEKPGLFMVARHEGYSTLITGNYIRQNDLKRLRDRVEHVNSLDSEGLDELFLNQIATGRDESGPGAYLGFVDMRMKTGSPVNFELTPVTDEMSFVTVSINVNH